MTIIEIYYVFLLVEGRTGTFNLKQDIYTYIYTLENIYLHV